MESILARVEPDDTRDLSVADRPEPALGSTWNLDPAREPAHAHLSADRLGELLDVRKSTMAGKAKGIRDALGLDPMDVEFCRRELLEEHPFAWLVEVDGIIIDARSMPRDLQAEARRCGLIPDIPLGEAA